MTHPLRDRLGLNLDLDDADAALALAKEVQPWFGVAKVGFELFGAAGPDVVPALRALDYRVFLDLKLHDIPTTVGRAARVLGRLGASYLNLHTLGGLAMLEAGVEGLARGAEDAGLPAPVALGVTILTSDGDAPDEELRRRATLARDAGCGGVICAVADIAIVHAVSSGLEAVTPGIRMEGDPVDDQARVATPRQALDAGASVILLGRSVTKANNPSAAAEAVALSLLA